MDWTVDALTLSDKPGPATYTATIEGAMHGWLKRFSVSRGSSRSHAASVLVTEAIRYWLKTRQPLNEDSPLWRQFDKKLPVRQMTFRLDRDVIEGLREISALSGIPASRIVSRILLDAKHASAETPAPTPSLKFNVGRPEAAWKSRKRA